jgi:hypothetical protein
MTMSSTTTARTVGDVELVEPASKSNGWFYVVKDDKGVHYYVSAIGGKVAHGVKVGTKFKLAIANPSKAISIYVLTST